MRWPNACGFVAEHGIVAAKGVGLYWAALRL
jgi:hypothetical protein